MFRFSGVTTGKPLVPGSADFVREQLAGRKPEGRITRVDATSWIALNTLRVGEAVRLPLAEDEAVEGTIVAVKPNADGTVGVAGQLTHAGKGTFTLESEGGRLAGVVRVTSKKLAYKIETEASGSQVIREVPLGDVVCDLIRRAPGEAAPAAIMAAATVPLIPVLNSRPTAAAQLYLDFDGEVSNDLNWGAQIDSPPFSGITDAIVTELFNRVKEDFIGFDINVTTDRAKYDNAPEGRRMHCIITPDKTAVQRDSPGEDVSGVLGYAATGSFRSTGNRVCWAYTIESNYGALCISHELGHTLGLSHDNNGSSFGYYSGHGTGATSWCPLMGSSGIRQVTQWSKGEFLGSSQNEDDLAIISSTANGFGYVADEDGSSPSRSRPIAFGSFGSTTINVDGVISSATDSDYFLIRTNGGTIQIQRNLTVGNPSPNLDVAVELLNASGATILASSNPADALTASISSSQFPGYFYVKISGSGTGTPLANPPTGYTSYGSVGAYALTITAQFLNFLHISGFTPAIGAVGSSVTINGGGFDSVSAVKFNGTTATYTVNSSSQITATVPAGATSGPITVTAASGTTTSPTDYILPPTITSFTPTSASAGATVTISGTNFTSASAVKFNGRSATFTVNSPTQISATVPVGITNGPLSVTNLAGTATSGTNFTNPPPTVTSFSPTSGGVGTNVTITGTNFLTASGVKFNGTAANTTIFSATQIVATVPAGATTGPISVTSPSGTGTSAANFTIALPAPTISSFTPTSGPVGTSVTITGTNYTSASTVTFNGRTASVTGSSTTQITATVPTGSTTGPVTVTNSSGTATSASNFTVTSSSAPTISSFTPASGSIGSSVTITGTNFTSTTSVRFSGVIATYTVNSSSQITARVPAGAATGIVSVTTPGGTANRSPFQIGNYAAGGGFDTPVTSSWTYSPPVSAAQPWTFVDAGVAIDPVDPNGVGFGVAGPVDGQYAFLQGSNARLSQSVKFPAAGTFDLFYSLASRDVASGGGGDVSYSVTLSGALLSETGSLSTGTGFYGVLNRFIVATAGTYTLTFANTSPSANGGVAFYVDSVVITRIPMANAQTVQAVEDTLASITFTGIDPDGDAIIAGGGSGAHGHLTASGLAGTYKLDWNYAGSDSFTSFVVDSYGSYSAPVTTTVNVSAVNDAPAFTLPQGTVTGLAGATWTPRGSATRDWRAIASSSDGSKLAAVQWNGKIYTSSDFGRTWSPRESKRSWNGITSSADGTKLAAVSSGQIYTSIDSGVNWTARATNRSWTGITSSSDGAKLAAVVNGGQIYTSTDSGVNWTARESSRSWISITSSYDPASSDGTKLVAVVQGGQIYTSTNSGVSWTARETNRNWSGVASSADGTKLAAVTYNGLIYTSTDSGLTWTARASGSRSWYSIASSSDGTKLVAPVNGGQLYTSSDAGVTWVGSGSNGSWRAVASSADGSRLVAGAYPGDLYTSAAPETPHALTVSNATASTMNAFARNISGGPANEAGQTVSFALSNNNGALFTNQPALASDGTLAFTPNPSATGTATVTVTAQDNGGTANGGVNTSATQTFTITTISKPAVTAPTFTDITTSGATLGGNVISDGGSAILERGVVYAPTAINPSPSLGGTGVLPKLTASGATGAFAVNATGLAQGTSYSFRPYATNSAGTTYTDVVGAFTTPAPEISLEQPAGTGLADGAGAVSFGSPPAGGSTERNFTIRNLGSATLTALSITIDGADGASFSVTAPPAAPVAPGGSTTFTVRFAPPVLEGTGTRNADLHIANNDSDENPFDIALTGGATGDTTPPKTTITSSPASPTRSTNATIAFAGSDDLTPVASVRYEGRLDGGTFALVTSPVALSDLPEGTHTYEVRAKDLVNNVDPTPASMTWTVDMTAPETTITSGPASPTRTTAAAIGFTGSDAVTAPANLIFRGAIDGGAEGSVTSPTVFTGLSEGAHRFQVVALDAAGNADASPATVSWTVDTTAPLVSVPASQTREATGPDGATVNFPPATATDAVSSAPVITYSQGSGSLFAIGATPVTVTAMDEAGNAGTGTFSVTVQDTTAPAITVPANIEAVATSAAGAVVSFSATANDLVDGAVTPLPDHASGSTFPIGMTTVLVTAADSRGNQGNASVTVTVTVPPNMPPVVAVDQTNGGALAHEVLVEFTGTGGANPGAHPQYGSLVRASDGAYYGMTSAGGVNSLGTVFRLAITGDVATPTTLVEFTGNGGANPGANPYGSLVLADDGAFYGTTAYGGANGSGTVFRLVIANGVATQTTLVNFTGASGDNPGAYPYGSLVLGGDGAFYGTTGFGGANNCGTVFRLVIAGGIATRTTLVNFTGSSGAYPLGSLIVGSDGAFYGMTNGGGVNDSGTVFRLVITGGVATRTTLVEFTGNSGANPGKYPEGSLVQGSDGGFYGMTPRGGANDLGAVFRLAVAGEVATQTTLVEFTGTIGSNLGASAYGSLVQGDDGAFYGMTFQGGADNLGTAFKLAIAGGVATQTTLLEFTGNGGANPGAYPRGGLAQGSDGSFYGMTQQGGTDGVGTVFRLATPLPAATGAEGAAVTKTGTFSDADGEAVTLSASHGIVTQDNATGTWTWTATGADGPATSTVTITATDSAILPNTGAAIFTFTVKNASPGLSLSAPAAANEDAAVEFALTAMDAATADQDAGFSWTIDFGDGSPATTLSAGTLSPLGRSHTFATPGIYTVTARATDKDGGVSEGATHTITIRDVTAPMITSVPSGLVAEAPSAGGAHVSYAAATASDNSGELPTITYSAASGSRFPVGVTMVLVTATDASGNAATASFEIMVNPFTDSDSDGMSDQYETDHGFDPQNGSDSALDSDGDGLTNAEEFQAGTDATNAGDKPQIGEMKPEPDGSFTLQIATVNDRSYRIEANNDFPTGAWLLVADNVSGTGGLVPVPDPGAAGNATRVYRLTVLP